MQYQRLLYHATAFFVSVVWGSTFITTKLLLINGFTPAQIFVMRFAIAYLVLLIFSMRNGMRLYAASWKDELTMAAMGVTGGSLYFLAENGAMNHTTTTNTALIVCLCPLIASILISFFYKSQRPSRTQIAGSLLAFAGVAVVEVNGCFVLKLSPVGDSLAFVACLSWAFYSLLMTSANVKYDALFITRRVFFWGVVSMIPYFIVHPSLNAHLFLERPRLLWNLIYLGWVASTLGFLCWNWTMKKLGVMTTTNYVYLNPVVTIVFAWYILSEPITFYFILGTIFILVGLYFCNSRPSLALTKRGERVHAQ